NMHYIFRELDDDGDGWPEGLGNAERAGMGEKKLNNTVYTIRGLRDLADMARSKGDVQTAAWAEKRARGMEKRFEETWWFGREGATQYADSIDRPPTGGDNTKIFQRHWIGVTPMEAELVNVTGNDSRPVPGLATLEHGRAALAERNAEQEPPCYRDEFGMYHTGTGPTVDGVRETGPFCDSHESEVPAERVIFTLNTAVMAVGEGNYGRLGENQQQHYMYGNADLQLPAPDEQPGAMPEIAPSPDYGRSIDRPFNERAMVLQAWGAYGTIWPVVHQWLGVRPDMGRGELEVTPQVPPGSPEISGDNIRLGAGSVNVSASASAGTYRTTVDLGVVLQEFVIGHTVPRRAEISSVTLDGAPVEDYKVRRTNRGKEVLVEAPTVGEHTLVVETAS
ncbi:MAG: glycogen debranching protein, partial [Actinobacteria bacterium]|nr:glycogen debranching protein [Actinomycetota bacterium]